MGAEMGEMFRRRYSGEKGGGGREKAGRFFNYFFSFFVARPWPPQDLKPPHRLLVGREADRVWVRAGDYRHRSDRLGYAWNGPGPDGDLVSRALPFSGRVTAWPTRAKSALLPLLSEFAPAARRSAARRRGGR